MTEHAVVNHEEWLAARRQFLAREKQFTRLRDELSAARRALPWERVEKNYLFEGEGGRESLADLFGSRSQLVVYHFMFAPEWEASCKSCAFWADNFNGIVDHLAQRDVSFVAISRAPLAKLQAQARRLRWTFKWVSTVGNEFNYDYNVSFSPEALQGGDASYNYGSMAIKTSTDMPGISAFVREGGQVFHTYSTYGRGLDMLNTAYHYLDIVPKGRNEAGLPYTMQWVQLRDLYDKST
jgi:predicted dithiol-disulfide oxidoreductase (DUF899 family)